MKCKQITIIILLAAICLLTAGCGASSQGSSDDSAATYIVDMTGREITLPEPVTRAVALTASDCEIIYALGAGDVLVGRGAYCDYPEEALSITPVQSGRESNIEEIIALSPQVVFMNTMDQTEEQIASLEAAGVTVVISNAADIAGVYEAITVIGAVLGKEDKAEALVAEMVESFAAIEAKAAVLSSGQEKSIYFEVSPLEWGLWASGRDTFMDEIAAMLGLSNIFSDVSGWTQVSEEQIISRNPDLIITITMYFDEGPNPEDEIASRNGWQTIRAVQNGDIFLTDSDEISRPGPRLVKAAERLYELIYGEE